ncbi:hypothetical protein LDENG_00299430 [Lucifuga dentata]|nr:hypothetical protein LDENG_00299430 [Lucifuga dentata]
MLDISMSLDCHVKQLTHSSFFHPKNIAKLRSVVSQAEMEMIIHAFISSRLDYCKSLFNCLYRTCLHCLQTVQNAAAWLLTKFTRSHITPILSSLHWLPLNFRVHFKILTLTFRAMHGQAPQYISDLLQSYTSRKSLKSSGQRLLEVPHTRLRTCGDHAFQVVAPKLWN